MAPLPRAPLRVNPVTNAVVESIEERCRFVFNHRGGRIGLTADGALVEEARNALLPVRQYERAPGGVTEWEIILRTEQIEEIPTARTNPETGD